MRRENVTVSAAKWYAPWTWGRKRILVIEQFTFDDWLETFDIEESVKGITELLSQPNQILAECLKNPGDYTTHVDSEDYETVTTLARAKKRDLKNNLDRIEALAKWARNSPQKGYTNH